ncbi:MAG: hypothetical protein HC898_05870, partial [Phycisphaerales bacterium]|nr:hypothetical protein [Phycisphaerales bacterium]
FEGSSGDGVDYYSVSLLASQVVTVQLGTSFTDGFLAMGVLNPDGQIIATNYSNTTSGIPSITFVADRPGEYTFAVVASGNTTFESDSSLLTIDYTFELQGVGSLAMGALVAGNVITSLSDGPASLSVLRGDVGGLIATNTIALQTTLTGDIVVSTGSLRAMVTGTFGTGGFSPQRPTLAVPQGDVGLIQATSTSGILYVISASAIGGNFQLLDSAGDMHGVYIANGGIGTIRVAGDFGNLAGAAPIISVDADGNGGGSSELIDVGGDLGTLQSGGPVITTGSGGNVRFMRIGGEIFQDLAFLPGNMSR